MFKKYSQTLGGKLAREKTFYLGMLNIKIHPNSPQKYLELFKETFKLKGKMNIRGDEYAMIGSFNPVDTNNPMTGYQGDIYKFIDLDLLGDWYNLDRAEEATEDEVSEIKIPDALKPHFQRFSYVFFPKKHRIAILTNNEKNKSFGISTARKFFDHLFNDEKLIKKFDEVDVIIEQAVEELENIVSTYEISTLNIVITRPNADDNDEDEIEVLERLQSQNIHKLDHTYRAQTGKRIEPNEDTMKLARVATSNGFVYASGKDADGKKIERSTIQYPQIEPFKYDHDKHNFKQLVFTKAIELLKIIT
jgi:hypothetical protein